MDSSLHINPYFESHPTVFFIGLKVVLTITVFVVTISLLLIWFKSPPQKSKIFRALLAYHLIVATAMNICICFFAMPIAYTPYNAVEFYGPLTDWGVPTIYQFSIAVNLTIAAATGISPLFYYRMDRLLPKGHFLDRKIIRAAFYLFVYGFCQIIPIPIIAIAFAGEDQHQLKEKLIQTHRVYHERFLNPSVIVSRIGLENPIVIFCVLLVIGGCILAVGCILFCVFFIYYLISKRTKAVSDKARKMQRNSFIALISLLAVIVFGLGVILPIIIFICSTNSYRQDILNIAILLGLSTPPAAAIAYIATYTPYRRFIMKIFCRAKVATNEDSLWINGMKTNIERRKSVNVSTIVL